jgi:hypothetical protein
MSAEGSLCFHSIHTRYALSAHRRIMRTRPHALHCGVRPSIAAPFRPGLDASRLGPQGMLQAALHRHDHAVHGCHRRCLAALPVRAQLSSRNAIMRSGGASGAHGRIGEVGNG